MDLETDDTAETIIPGRSPSACPRCAQALTTEEFYGVCHACRIALREANAPRPRSVTVEEYEPKMNVTPNAVASKE